MTSIRSARPVAAMTLLLACGACRGDKPAPAASQEPPPPPPAASASAAPSAAAAAAPKASSSIPTLVPKKVAASATKVDGAYAIEGAVVVTDKNRVGRVTAENIEWFGKIPPRNATFGDNVIYDVRGRWPEPIGALYHTTNEAAAMPTYFPVAGKGTSLSASGGGESADVAGVGRVGESVVVAAFNGIEGLKLQGVSGPPILRKTTTREAMGCGPAQEGALPSMNGAFDGWSYRLAATGAGTLVGVGSACNGLGMRAEVWDKASTPRVVDLRPFWKKPRLTTLAGGEGDELFAFAGPFEPILRFRAGAFTAVPDLGRAPRSIFVAGGKLHALLDHAVFRLDGDTWAPAYRLDPAVGTARPLPDGDAVWALVDGAIQRLQPESPAPWDGACEGWFVHVYQVSGKNEPGYSYPTTRSAMASFPALSQIELVEFDEDGLRLGIKAQSREQADAVVAHVRANMKDEAPSVLCYVPSKTRSIPWDGKKR